jgi:hypothetical protein
MSLKQQARSSTGCASHCAAMCDTSRLWRHTWLQSIGEVMIVVEAPACCAYSPCGALASARLPCVSGVRKHSLASEQSTLLFVSPGL